VVQVRRVQRNVILIDGDIVREAFGDDLGHTIEDRLINARRICQIGKLLDDQGIHVVCAILSLFPETREWNRKNLKSYYEVFIDTSMKDLIQRDTKDIYRRFNAGEIRDVAGMDIEFPAPNNADLIINNTNSVESLLAFAGALAGKITSSAHEV
jgi:adenylylsulfate kinase-like enzyme